MNHAETDPALVGHRPCLATTPIRRRKWPRVKSDAHSHRFEVIPSLDGIRAISVLIVVLGHSGLEALVPGGLGVTIFFFLSGYLITTLMLTEHERTGGINIFNFYTRRVFRLMPPLLVTLAIAYGLTYARLLSGGITDTGLAAQLLYFANYYGLFFDPGNTIPDGTGILWSLAVEEHFYIFYPLLMTLMLGMRSSAPHNRHIARRRLSGRSRLAHSSCAVAGFCYGTDLLCIGHAYRLDYLRMHSGGRHEPAAADESAEHNVLGLSG